VTVNRPMGPRPVTPASILAAKLGRLTDRMADEPELREAAELAAGLDPYVERWSTPASPALEALAKRTAAHDWTAPLEQEMLSGHVEGQVLAMLVHVSRARRVLEIGMFTGYSALAMAEALPADGVVVACEVDADVARFARGCFEGSPGGHKIDIRVGPAQDTLRGLAGERFDLIFIDADKAGYLEYLNTVLELSLLAPHGLVCVDNTLMQGQPWTAGEPTANGVAIDAFNRAVAADPRVEQVIVPLRDGLTLIRPV
jgi:predicted O-methyltransferase YrrM